MLLYNVARNHSREYELTVRQEPKQARMCGVGGKADRRPIDPPPIVQLRVIDPSQRRHSNDSRADSPDVAASLASQSFLQNPYYFMFATLAKPDEDVELHWLKDGKTRCTTGSVVSSLYHLKDTEAGGADAGFFVFPDLSVRTEGSYRLKLSLFEVVGSSVYHCKSIFSAPFYVYTAKKFPGMEESTPLSCSLADQGIKIRIRKDIRVRKRPLPGNEAPTPIPIPIPGPPQSGAFGPVPVRLDDSEADEERGQDEGSHRILDGPHLTESPHAERSRVAESEKDSPREEPRRMSGRRDSGSSSNRRDSTSERGTKRIRADDSASASGSMSGGAGPSSAGWGPIDPALTAPPPPVAQPAPPPTSPGEHHYASAPAPHSAPPPPSYEQRYAPAPAQLSAPPPAPGSHHAQHAPPPPVHHYSAPPPPHPYAHHHPYSYPPASAPGQPWYDPYAHHQPYGVPPPPSHHPHAHHAPPPPRYGEYPAYAPQPYAYYEHAPPPHHQQPPAQHQSQHQVQPQHQVLPPPPPSHHSHHVYHHPGYGAASAPPSPPTNHPAPSHTGHAADTRSQNSSASYTPAGYGSAPPPVSAPSAATHHHYAPPPPSPYAQYGHSTQAHQQSSQSQASSASQTGSRGQYQLSTPPHQHQSGYSTYPPVPGSGGGGGSLSSAASSSGTNPTSADGGQGVMMQNDAYGSYAGSATGGRDVHRIQLAPLRGSQVSPPPQSGDRSTAGGKKNPLSIGNIISDDTR
ncbi:uncharacterized protein LAESUDRAFT_739035 [Laetiporus sulphureus 93-53]|uniref:Velvet domain-containing protein n=1 Tax=Laetiporus sulphureus 93-53 TaxID=1314785 RepID=A0A165BXM3_9APHY|nr:uncharacterized protein LAESUDRAFT_739035 [Laetiporus sulphureus 93-53]KZT01840.1 hypothetical protein LAESUDRAFT_739035 [Laetiporus sulphureus 93-53]